jgi:hypothetical protein
MCYFKKIKFRSFFGALIVTATLLSACRKDPEPADQIFFRDIIPDTTMVYDIEVIFPDPYQCQGDFNYFVDLDQDGTDDFGISGSTWPGHFDHVGVMWYNDHDTKVYSLHEQAFIATSPQGEMCNETDIQAGDPINDKLKWSDQVRISYENWDNMLYCNWKGDYIAVKLVKNGHNYLGWIDIDGYETPTIKEMAVNLTPDKKILAGQKF